MNRYAASFAIALLAHAAILFGIRLRETQAIPLAPGEQMEVSLVAAAPEVAPATNNNPPPETQPPEPPPPDPQPESMPEPTPEPEMQEPVPATEPKPAPQPLPKPVEKPRVATPRKSTAPAPAMRGNPNARATGTSRPAATMISSVRPRYRYNPQPQYPAAAKAQRQQGRVMLEVEVNASGHPTGVRLKASSGFPALDQAAIEAVRRWEFEPARIGGVPTASSVEVPVRFSLSN